MANQKVIISVLADTRKFKASMREAGRESGLTKLTGSVKKLGKAFAAAAAAASAMATAVAVKAVKAASDLEQSAGAIDDVFKSAAGQMHGLAKEAASAVGLSRNSYNQLATIIGTQLKNGVVAIDQLGAKTDGLIRLGADLAAGFGGSTADAVAALSSALKGERDPIEKYGVSLKQAAIDAKAAELGFTKVGGALSQEASNAATLALIMEQTTDMHGKFSRESDTLAHKTEVLKAQLENAAATIGTYLIPAVSAAVGWLSARLGPALEVVKTWVETVALPVFNRLANYLKSVAIPALSALYSEVKTRLIPVLQAAGAWITGTLVPSIMALAKGLWENRAVIIPIVAAIGAAVASFRVYIGVVKTAKALTTAFAIGTQLLGTVLKANPIGLIISGVGALVAGLTIAYQKHEGFRNAVNTAWTAIQGAVKAVVAWFSAYVVPTLTAVWGALIAGVTAAKDIFSLVWSAISTAVQTAVGIIRVVLDPLVAFISGAFTTVAAIISGVWSVSWSVFSSAVSNAWASVTSILSIVASFVSGVFSTVSNLVKGNWAGAWNAFKATISEAWNSAASAIQGGISRVASLVATLPGTVVSAIGNVGSILWKAGKGIIDGFISGLTSGFNAVRSTLGRLTSWIPDWKGPAPRDARLLTRNGKLVISGFIDGLESQYGAVRRSLSGLTGTIPGITPSGTLALAGSAQSVTVRPIEVHVHQLATTPDTGRAIVRAIREYEDVSGRRLS
ncbi:hypothetical protein [Trueperella pyogenes]|uniref:phage tail protein n=1 Tax=Trueperella pyogenes TaxID=1661 RepID=UPI003248F93D